MWWSATKLGAAWLCAILGILVLLAWPVSCWRVDGITATRQNRMPQRPKASKGLRGELRVLEGDPSRSYLDLDADFVWVIRGFERDMYAFGITACQRRGRVLFVQSGRWRGADELKIAPDRAPLPWPGYDGFEYGVSRSQIDLGTALPIDDAGRGLALGGIDYAAYEPKFSFAPTQRVLAIPHWLIALILLPWPVARLRRWRRRRGATRGFEVEVPADAGAAGVRDGGGGR